MLRLILGNFKFELIQIFVLCFISELAEWWMFITIQFILSWIISSRNEVEGAIVILSFILIQLIAIMFRTAYLFYSNKLSVKITSSMACLMYQKILRMSQSSITETSSGKLISLVTSDLQNLEKTMWYIPYIIVGPILTIAWFAYFAIWYYEASPLALFVFWILLFLYVILMKKVTQWRNFEGKV